MTDPIKPATDEEIANWHYNWRALLQRLYAANAAIPYLDSLKARIEADRATIAAKGEKNLFLQTQVWDLDAAIADLRTTIAARDAEIERLSEQRFCQFCKRLEGPR